jgi:tetratricopeptide (TPR) repeat protein
MSLTLSLYFVLAVHSQGFAAPVAVAPEKNTFQQLDLALRQKQKDFNAGLIDDESYRRFRLELRTLLDHAYSRAEPKARDVILYSQILNRLEDSASAMDALSQALRLDPSNTNLQLARAQLLYEMKDYPEALVQAERILKSDPSNARALALKHFSEGRVAPDQHVPFDALAAVKKTWSTSSVPDHGQVRTHKKPHRTVPGIDALIQRSQPESQPLLPAFLFSGLAATCAGILWLGKKMKDNEDLVSPMLLTAVGTIILGSSAVFPPAVPVLVSGGELAIASAQGAVLTQSAAVVGAAATSAGLTMLAKNVSSQSSSSENPKSSSPLNEQEVRQFEAEANSIDPVDANKELTKAGRSFAKHASRPGSSLPKSGGSPGMINEAARKMIHEILTRPQDVRYGLSGRFGEIIDIVGSNGLGVRFTTGGRFCHFLD